jgi:hypothetical protein
MNEKTEKRTPGNPNWQQGGPSPNPAGRPPTSRLEKAIAELKKAMPPATTITVTKSVDRRHDVKKLF